MSRRNILERLNGLPLEYVAIAFNDIVDTIEARLEYWEKMSYASEAKKESESTIQSLFKQTTQQEQQPKIETEVKI